MPTATTSSTPASRIAEVYRDHADNWDACTRAIASLARQDDEVLNYLAAIGTRAAIAQMANSERRSIRCGESVEHPLTKASIDGCVQRAVSRWLDFRLPGGARLGDATKAMVAAAALYRRRHGESELRHATMLEAIKARMDDSAPVSKFWTEETLAKLAAKTGVKL